MKLIRLLALALLCVFFVSPARSAPTLTACPRFPAGSTLPEPEDLFSVNGVLRVQLSYTMRVDAVGNALFCFTDVNGSQSPTLHVHPGDELLITLKNGLPPEMAQPMSMSGTMSMQPPSLVVSATVPRQCGAAAMNGSSVNMHFHGTNTAPVCHGDEVIQTIVNSGQTFDYDIHFPLDEPPGLYWYHPHSHGIAESAVQGGASGALIVEGIQDINPEVAGLPQRLLIVRDNVLTGQAAALPNAPTWDVSLNYTPVTFPQYQPVAIPVRTGQKQFWRLLNA